MTTSISAGLACATPVTTRDRVVLGHGSGGKLSNALVRDRFLPHFRSASLNQLGDAAVVPVDQSRIAVSTDTFVVSPLEFPGGNIGTLAVNGTVNDLVMMGAEPCYLTAGFVLEEGLPFDVLDRVVAAMAETARIAEVQLIAGDTKVVERGKGDGMFINTTGIGLVDSEFQPNPTRVSPGDAIIVSGPIGVHGMTILSTREGLEFSGDLTSDTACLYPLVNVLRAATDGEVSALRDPTRGGVASTLNEIAAAAKVGMVIEEDATPIPPPVSGACEMLGLDPLYVANEGNFVAFVPGHRADDAVAALRQHPLGRHACRIGLVVADHPRTVVMRTRMGGTRIVDLLPGDQLPRIC
jgi:hydrogenase expression/formation protein HypE